MAFTLDDAAIEEAVVTRAVDRFFDGHYDFGATLKSAVEKRLNALFAEKADAAITAAVDAALDDGFNREFVRVSPWGEKQGEPTTIRKELEGLLTNFWQQKVDKQGKPTENGYNSITRAEYQMTRIAGDDFIKNLEQHLIGSAAAFKDGLRVELRDRVDQMMGNLFHVQTAQDKAEGRYK
jgi:excinuclease UvrABC helicase subunit UvrB